MILTPKRKLTAGFSTTGGGSTNMEYIINHITQSTITEIETMLTAVIARLHVQERLRIPVGTDKFDVG